MEGPIRSMSLHPEGIKLWTLSGISDPDDPAIPPQVDLNLGDDWDLVSMWSALAALYLTYLESLMAYNILRQDVIWATIFGSLRWLRNNNGYHNDGFLKVFSHGLFEDGVTQAININFKALRHLTIDNSTFDEPYRDGFQSTFNKVLIRCLSARQKNGMVLSSLILETSKHVAAADVKKLESIVKRVDVRG
ncbi:hypothetical protein FPV67DRAFT_1103466 [Lyophyllum atratum]|nr:hypothetical protein FPV67DRAFT_1103466 [Lyophyllum atratum]